eukprot:TRINITY_DN4868_c0_g1_i1.p1 TRINITY_DN4868_c0_g1~~TRINITY_DN4868_c0_g1_i1.p1  ORF type:complete len:255 (-),score=31.21 TRINITY_DN4868_c0_g1_i1:107-871(-)
MAESCRIHTIDCELRILDGSTCTFTVQLDWTVATLKEHIEDEVHVPCYSQMLSDASRRLRNKEKLRDVYLAQGCVGACLPLFLCFLEPPSRLRPEEVQRAWEAFRVYSTDYGDTIPRSNLSQVMRYLQIQVDDSHVKGTIVDLEDISFEDVLSVMATLKDASIKNEPKEFVEDDCYFFEIEDVCKRDEQQHDAPNVVALIESVRRRQRKTSCQQVERCPLARGATSCNTVPTEEERSQSVSSTDGLALSTVISL